MSFGIMNHELFKSLADEFLAQDMLIAKQTFERDVQVAKQAAERDNATDDNLMKLIHIVEDLQKRVIELQKRPAISINLSEN